MSHDAEVKEHLEKVLNRARTFLQVQMMRVDVPEMTVIALASLLNEVDGEGFARGMDTASATVAKVVGDLQ